MLQGANSMDPQDQFERLESREGVWNSDSVEVTDRRGDQTDGGPRFVEDVKRRWMAEELRMGGFRDADEGESADCVICGTPFQGCS